MKFRPLLMYLTISVSKNKDTTLVLFANIQRPKCCDTTTNITATTIILIVSKYNYSAA